MHTTPDLIDQPACTPDRRPYEGAMRVRVALYVGRNGAGLRPCARAARRLQATTVTALGGGDGQPMTQAAALDALLGRLSRGEVDLILAWLGEGAAASLVHMARLPIGLIDALPVFK